MPGPVSAAHAEFEDDCSACHAPMTETPQATLCTACHEDVGVDLSSASGFHGKHPDVGTQQCQSCHREHKGRDADTLNFPMATFDHSNTDFPLLWSHSGLSCQSCHEPDTPSSAAPTQCSSCHAKDDPHGGNLGNNCSSCHNEKTWLETSFQHADTGFNLTGAHQSLTCDSCHADNVFSGTPSGCAGCHSEDDPHEGTLGTQCQDCHSTSSWGALGFDHARQTGFALAAGHAGLTCDSCHLPGTPVSQASGECSSCHQKDDVHKGNNGTDCASCHTVADWQASTFDHLAASNFALLGSHQKLSCDSCHSGAVTDALPTTCAGCHTEDPHEGQLGERCASCHNNDSWVGKVRFDHALSSFPLLGAHADLVCLDCHLNPRFHDAQAQCSSCHASEDVHNGNFGTECQSCHQPADWAQVSFDHGQMADFALQGAHASLTCESCHSKPHLLEAASPQQCSQCHASDDPHENRFGSDCAQCHSTEQFLPVRGY
ncbi:MAG: cytochrome c3 family protein [Pseudomonadales bacterium]